MMDSISPMDLQRRPGERVAGHLFRVRGEFNKFRQWKEHEMLKGRPRGQIFEWDEDIDEDIDIRSQHRSVKAWSHTASPMEDGWWSEAADDELPTMQCTYAFEQAQRKAIAEIEAGIRLYFEPPRPIDEGPNAFSAAVAARAWEALRSKHKRVPHMQSPWEPKAVERQARHLRRAYSASSALLPRAATAAQRGEYHNDASSGHRSESKSSPAISILRRMGLEQRLASGQGGGGRGRGRSGDRKLVDTWLRQLAEDYPQDFCDLSTGSHSVKDLSSTLATESDPSTAQIASELWVLRLHGSPMKEEDWQRRMAWLSRSGRLWLGPPKGESGSASLQLRGDLVSNWYVMRALHDLPETLDQIQIYAFGIDSPMAKYHRRKLFASSNEELVEEWIKLCLTPPRQR